jgi:hypothetical protein
MDEEIRWWVSGHRRRMTTGLALLLGSVGLAPAASAESGPSAFEDASVRFEQNATDGDVEVVFEVKAGDEGLAKLTVVSPDGRPVVDFKAPDASTLGIREFSFESPEPADVEGLKAAYPEGVYRFAGATASGDEFRGESTLSHELPATASFVRPRAEAQNVSVENLEIRWSPVENVSAYVVEIENDELEVSLEARLPGSSSMFRVPGGFLRPATEYELAIGTVAAEGNISFVETAFTTAD